MGIDADSVAAGGVEGRNLTWTGAEVVVGVLGVDAALDGVHVRLVVASRNFGSAGNFNLLANQVVVGHFFGNGVLHLNSGVHLHEVEVAVLVDQELDGSGALVAYVLGGLHGGVAHGLAQFWRHKRRRRLFEQLLVAALDRAVALAQVRSLPRLVPHYLNLNVARLFDELFHVHAVVAKGGGGFLAGGFPRFFKFGLGPNGAHSLAPATGGGLHHHRVADGLGGFVGMVKRVEQAF